VAPFAGQLAPLRDAGWANINHPGLAAIYPPLAQMVFAVVALVSPGFTVLALKLLFAAVDVGNVVLLRQVLRLEGVSQRRVAWYALNPACAIEFAWSGHYDSLVITAILATWIAFRRGHLHFAGAGLAAASLLRFFPALALPHLVLCRGTGPVSRLGAIAVFCLLAGLCYAPYAGAGKSLFASADVYRAKWRHNESLFAAVEMPLHGLESMRQELEKPRGGGMTGFDVWHLNRGEPVGSEVARRILEFGGLLIVLATFAVRLPFPRALYWILGYALVASPVVHPWYVLLILPFAAVYGSPAWLWLSVAVQLTYLPAAIPVSRAGDVELAVRLLEYVPFYAILALPAIGAAMARAEGIVLSFRTGR
jgi:hypothetical protein